MPLPDLFALFNVAKVDINEMKIWKIIVRCHSYFRRLDNPRSLKKALESSLNKRELNCKLTIAEEVSSPIGLETQD